jgi:hypothetical protein
MISNRLTYFTTTKNSEDHKTKLLFKLSLTLLNERLNFNSHLDGLQKAETFAMLKWFSLNLTWSRRFCRHAICNFQLTHFSVIWFVTIVWCMTFHWRIRQVLHNKWRWIFSEFFLLSLSVCFLHGVKVPSSRICWSTKGSLSD